MAFSATHAAHRLNAPHAAHVIDPEDGDDFWRWVDQSSTFERDPLAMHADGTSYIQRGTFGEYIRDQFERTCDRNPSDSEIRHITSRAIAIEESMPGLVVTLETGERLNADIVIVATGNEPPARLREFQGAVESNLAYVADPWAGNAVERIHPNDEVLLIGSALTAADVAANLLANGHTGRIDSVSRTGLLPARRPRPQPEQPALSNAELSSMAWDRVSRTNTLFVEKHGELDRVSQICRALRAEIKDAEELGLSWHGPFDDLRDSVRAVWPRLENKEKRRFLRHLRRWYDAHRFRLPPQLEQVLDEAVAAGQLSYVTARIRSANIKGQKLQVGLRERKTMRTITETYSYVINCTGPSGRPHLSTSPFIHALLASGLCRTHPTALGFDVDHDCRALNAAGDRVPSLVFLGALTLGAFGEPLATPWIAAQIWRIVPGLIAQLQHSG
jgi:uncharacterized NAD(P)/FAD-binding protein YdhS